MSSRIMMFIIHNSSTLAVLEGVPSRMYLIQNIVTGSRPHLSLRP